MDSDWLEPNIDVDKKLNPDMMSELAQIDSKTIEDVFKGVLNPSPTTGEFLDLLGKQKKKHFIYFHKTIFSNAYNRGLGATVAEW